MFFRGMHIVKTLQRMKLGESKIVGVKKKNDKRRKFLHDGRGSDSYKLTWIVNLHIYLAKLSLQIPFAVS